MMNLLLLIPLNEEYLLYMVEEGPTSSKLDHIVSIWRHPTVFSKNDILECDLEVAWDHVWSLVRVTDHTIADAVPQSSKGGRRWCVTLSSTCKIIGRRVEGRHVDSNSHLQSVTSLASLRWKWTNWSDLVSWFQDKPSLHPECPSYHHT